MLINCPTFHILTVVCNAKKMNVSRKNIVLGIIGILLLWGISALVIYLSFDSTDRGTFGDMFGAINALFSGLALFGIIISILIQQNELNLQRKELIETRLEFKTNRITNIMFKQLDYLNAIIDKGKFTTSPENGLTDYSGMIDDFIYEMNFLINDTKAHIAKKIIEKNRSTISILLNKIEAILDGIDEILDFYELDKKEVHTMKKMFKTNINPSFYKLLHLKIKMVDKKFDENDEIAQIEKKLVEIELTQCRKILKFGKEE